MTKIPYCKRCAIVVGMILILASSAFACGDNWIVKAKKNGAVLCSDGQVLIAICHKGVTLNVSSKAFKAHSKHGDTLGACVATCGAVLEAESDWKITEYPAQGGTQPTMVQRAVDPDYGVRWDKLSDGSYTVFCNDENGQIAETVNTKWGEQNKIEYYENGAIKTDISKVCWNGDAYVEYEQYISSYSESGTMLYTLKKNTRGVIVNTNTGESATQEQIAVYKQTFSR